MINVNRLKSELSLEKNEIKNEINPIKSHPDLLFVYLTFSQHFSFLKRTELF